MLLLELFEARRDLSQKQSGWEQIIAYAGGDYYVSYTHDLRYGKIDGGDNNEIHGVRSKKNSTGAKIGINPRSTYHTPTGIYSYPISHVIDKKGYVEFGQDRPYVWILEAVQPILDLDTIQVEEIGPLNLKVISILGVSEHFGEVLIDYAADYARPKISAAYFWNLLRLGSRVDQDKASFLETKEDIEEYLDNLNTDKASRPAQWNKLIRQLGYGAVHDSRGIIHPNEPVQTVFMSMKALKVVKLIHNIEPSSTQQAYEQNPNLFAKHVRDGTLSVIETGELLNQHFQLWEPFQSWNSLPQDFRDYVERHPTKWLSRHFLANASYSADAIIEIISGGLSPTIRTLRSRITKDIMSRIAQSPRLTSDVLKPLFALILDEPILAELTRKAPESALTDCAEAWLVQEYVAKYRPELFAKWLVDLEHHIYPNVREQFQLTNQ